MRLAFLAVSSTALLTIGTVLAVQVILPPAPSRPAVREAVAAAPAPAVQAAPDKETAKTAAAPLSEATAPTVVRVKTVRIEPERPLGTTEAEQAAVAAEGQQQDAASTGEPPTISPARDRGAVLKTGMPEAGSMTDTPATRASAPAKPPVVAAKRTSHRKRNQEQLAGDDVAKDTLSYAPKEKGPESLNPLGKLLSGR